MAGAGDMRHVVRSKTMVILLLLMAGYLCLRWANRRYGPFHRSNSPDGMHTLTLLSGRSGLVMTLFAVSSAMR